MKAGIPVDWAVSRDGSGGDRLRVYHASSDVEWKARGIACWRGELEDVSEFRTSRAAVVSCWRDSSGGAAYFIKRLTSRGSLDWAKHLFRGSRGMRALVEGLRLESCGFRAPRAVCLVEHQGLGSVTESLLITEEIENVFSVYDWFHESMGNIKERRHLLAAYGTEVGRMHARGIFHGDMRKSNTLFNVSPEGYTFFWLDNERNHQYSEIPQGKRVKNLNQVNMERAGVTLTDRMRFWKAYATAAGIAKPDQKRIQRAVVKKTQKRWKQNPSHARSG